MRLYPRLRAEELLSADRNFYSSTAWDGANLTTVEAAIDERGRPLAHLALPAD